MLYDKHTRQISKDYLLVNNQLKLFLKILPLKLNP